MVDIDRKTRRKRRVYSSFCRSASSRHRYQRAPPALLRRDVARNQALPGTTRVDADALMSAQAPGESARVHPPQRHAGPRCLTRRMVFFALPPAHRRRRLTSGTPQLSGLVHDLVVLGMRILLRQNTPFDDKDVGRPVSRSAPVPAGVRQRFRSAVGHGRSPWTGGKQDHLPLPLERPRLNGYPGRRRLTEHPVAVVSLSLGVRTR